MVMVCVDAVSAQNAAEFPMQHFLYREPMSSALAGFALKKKCYREPTSSQCTCEIFLTVPDGARYPAGYARSCSIWANQRMLSCGAPMRRVLRGRRPPTRAQPLDEQRELLAQQAPTKHRGLALQWRHLPPKEGLYVTGEQLPPIVGPKAYRCFYHAEIDSRHLALERAGGLAWT
ncbi:uncharacterized protein LOC144128218 [Amblyomma americanum]